MEWNIKELYALKREYNDKYKLERDEQSYLYLNSIKDVIKIYKGKSNFYDEGLHKRQSAINIIEEGSNFIKNNPFYYYILLSLGQFDVSIKEKFKNIDISDQQLLDFIKIFNKSKEQEELFNKCISINPNMYMRKDNKSEEISYVFDKGKTFIYLVNNHNVIDYYCGVHETEHALDNIRYDNLDYKLTEVNSFIDNKYTIDLVKELVDKNEGNKLNDFNNYLALCYSKRYKDTANFLANYTSSMSHDKLVDEVNNILDKNNIDINTLCCDISFLEDQVFHNIGFMLCNIIYENCSIYNCNSMAEQFINNPCMINYDTVDDAVKIIKKTL